MHANCKTEEKKTPNDPAHDLGQVGGKQRTERARRSAHIRFDEDWDEWVVMFYLDGRHQTRADYHTDDEDDALGTAKLWINQ